MSDHTQVPRFKVEKCENENSTEFIVLDTYTHDETNLFSQFKEVCVCSDEGYAIVIASLLSQNGDE